MKGKKCIQQHYLFFIKFNFELFSTTISDNVQMADSISMQAAAISNKCKKSNST